MEINYSALGNKIRMRRRELNMTQEKLSELLSISIPHMSNIERGKTKVSMQTLVNISNVLCIGIDNLLCNTLDTSIDILKNDISWLLEDCNAKELEFLIENLNSLKKSLRNLHGLY